MEAVELPHNPVVAAQNARFGGAETGFEVRTDGRCEDDEFVFGGGAHAQQVPDPDDERSDVKRCARFVGRNETFVEFDGLNDGFGK